MEGGYYISHKLNPDVARRREQKEKWGITDEEFEEQLKEQVVTVDGHEIRFYRILPPEGPREKPVVYIGGFVTSAETYAELKEHVRAGREVVFVNPTRGFGNESEDTKRIEENGIAPAVIQAKAKEVFALLEELDVTDASLVGHSQGAAVASFVTLLQAMSAHSRIKHLVLSNPPGLQGEDSTSALLGRASKSQVRQFADSFGGKGLAETRRRAPIWWNAQKVNRMGEDTRWRFDQEVPALAKVNLVSTLKLLRKAQESLSEDERTQVTLVTSHQDDLFPQERIYNHLGLPENPQSSEETEVLFDFVDKHVSFLRGSTHDALMFEEPGAMEQILTNKGNSG